MSPFGTSSKVPNNAISRDRRISMSSLGAWLKSSQLSPLPALDIT